MNSDIFCFTKDILALVTQTITNSTIFLIKTLRFIFSRLQLSGSFSKTPKPAKRNWQREKTIFQTINACLNDLNGLFRQDTVKKKTLMECNLYFHIISSIICATCHSSSLYFIFVDSISVVLRVDHTAIMRTH